MIAFRHIARLALALLCTAGTLRAQSNVGESAAFAFDTRDSVATTVAESATFVFDTRDSNSTHVAESAGFAFDTRTLDGHSASAISGVFLFNTKSLMFSGIVRSLTGTPLAGASIKLQRFGTVFWQGISAADGSFPPNLAATNYTVVVEKTGYRTMVRNVAGVAGGNGTLEFFLAELDQPPPPNDVNRVPSLSSLGETATGSRLKAYSGGIFTEYATLHPDRMTIVLCHGWRSSPSEWAVDMAERITARHTLGSAPNIVVWDWEESASGTVLSIVGKIDVAAKEGLLLGTRLQEALGTGYAERVHFIGHSLGTIVNRYACDFVHASFPPAERSGMNSPAPWSAMQTRPHVTLLDEAEIASAGGTKVVTSALITALINGAPAGIVAGADAAAKNWKTPIPKDAVWVDNYISAVGFQHDNSVNVCLLDSIEKTLNPVTAHGYAHVWYRRSISPPAGVADASVGFARSFERALFSPPSGTGLTNGSLWFEDTATADPLDLFLYPNPPSGYASAVIAASYTVQVGRQIKEKVVTGTGIAIQAGEAAAIALGNGLNDYVVKPLDAVGQHVLDGYVASIETVGEIGGTVIFKTGQVITETKEKAGELKDATMEFTASAINHVVPDSVTIGPVTIPFLRIRLTTQTPPAPSGGNGLAANPQTQPAYAWMTVHVPANAGFLAFDFTVTGQPVEDRIVCAINDQNVFNLPAKFAPDSVPSSTDLIDVTAFAGQDVELFFGITGGTSAGCELAVDGIRFVTIPVPKVGLADAGANVAVKWPAAASGWVLEEATSLNPLNWQLVPTAGTATVELGVATIERPKNSTQRFYRLRRTE